jgi:hypothetical protein
LNSASNRAAGIKHSYWVPDGTARVFITDEEQFHVSHLNATGWRNKKRSSIPYSKPQSRFTWTTNAKDQLISADQHQPTASVCPLPEGFNRMKIYSCKKEVANRENKAKIKTSFVFTVADTHCIVSVQGYTATVFHYLLLLSIRELSAN